MGLVAAADLTQCLARRKATDVNGKVKAQYSRANASTRLWVRLLLSCNDIRIKGQDKFEDLRIDKF